MYFVLDGMLFWKKDPYAIFYNSSENSWLIGDMDWLIRTNEGYMIYASDESDGQTYYSTGRGWTAPSELNDIYMEWIDDKYLLFTNQGTTFESYIFIFIFLK